MARKRRGSQEPSLRSRWRLGGRSGGHIADKRKQESLEGHLRPEALGGARAGIETVDVDTGIPYIQATMMRVAAATGKIVPVRLYISGCLGETDSVRNRGSLCIDGGEQ